MSRGRSFRFEADGDTLVDLDGETIGACRSTSRVLPRAFSVGSMTMKSGAFAGRMVAAILLLAIAAGAVYWFAFARGQGATGRSLRRRRPKSVSCR